MGCAEEQTEGTGFSGDTDCWTVWCDQHAEEWDPGLIALQAKWGTAGIEPTTSPTLRENHTTSTRPSYLEQHWISQFRHTTAQCAYSCVH